MSDREYELELAIVLALKDPRKELPREGVEVLFHVGCDYQLGIYDGSGEFVARDESWRWRAESVSWWAYLPEVPEGEGER